MRSFELVVTNNYAPIGKAGSDVAYAREEIHEMREPPAVEYWYKIGGDTSLSSHVAHDAILAIRGIGLPVTFGTSPLSCRG